MSPGRPTRLLLCALALALLGSATAAAAPAGSGDEPLFPHAGDSRIDVRSYHAYLAYSGDGTIRATTGMRIEALARLRRFSLDLEGLRVRRVDLGGGGADFSRRPGKLVIEPLDPIAKGERFTIAVFYSGRPRTLVDEDGSREGWVPTADGALAVGEPEGTAAWLPCNNIPRDKARFRAEVVVPNGLTAVANGRLTGVGRQPGRRVFHWSEDSPMSTYLAVVDIGRGELLHGTIAGHPSWTFLDPKLAPQARRVLGHLPEIIGFESRLFGPYPFAAAGSIVDDEADLGYALESQSRPIYPYVPDLTTVVHETAHQWFGDSVGLKRWPDIWLNEGFATWTEWYYAERHGGRGAAAIFRKLLRVPAADKGFWNPPTARPGKPKHLFGPSVYVRGAMTLQALREKVGTRALLRTLRRWATTHRHGSGATGEFISLAERVSGRDLGAFFQRWLFAPGKP